MARKLGIRQKEKLFNEFARLAKEFLIEFLAVKNEKYTHEFHDAYDLPTPVGSLRVTLSYNPEYCSPTIFQKFEDVERAMKSGYVPISLNGKWNFHYTVDRKDEAMDILIYDWQHQIRCLMKKPVVLPNERFEIFNLKDKSVLINRYHSKAEAEKELQDLLQDEEFHTTNYPQNRIDYEIRKSPHPCEMDKSRLHIWWTVGQRKRDSEISKQMESLEAS